LIHADETPADSRGRNLRDIERGEHRSDTDGDPSHNPGGDKLMAVSKPNRNPLSAVTDEMRYE
jgi:hypothetical protein